jgi:hypothetical protein
MPSNPIVTSKPINQLAAASNKFRRLVEGSALVRLALIIGVISVAALLILWTMFLAPAGRSAILLKLAGLIGYFVPAAVLGALWGFIRYSCAAWGNATLILCALTVVLWLWALSRPELMH